MGFLFHLFRRGREEPVAPPTPPQPSEPEPEPEPEPAPEPEPEPVEAGHAPPAAGPEPTQEPGPPVELSLTLGEVTAALRAAGSDGIRIGFLSRDYLRAGEEERSAARRRLVDVLGEQLCTRGLLAQDGRFELREESRIAD